jgi:hypothetical protein
MLAGKESDYLWLTRSLPHCSSRRYSSTSIYHVPRSPRYSRYALTLYKLISRPCCPRLSSVCISPSNQKPLPRLLPLVTVNPLAMSSKKTTQSSKASTYDALDKKYVHFPLFSRPIDLQLLNCYRKLTFAEIIARRSASSKIAPSFSKVEVVESYVLVLLPLSRYINDMFHVPARLPQVLLRSAKPPCLSLFPTNLTC